MIGQIRFAISITLIKMSLLIRAISQWYMKVRKGFKSNSNSGLQGHWGTLVLVHDLLLVFRSRWVV